VLTDGEEAEFFDFHAKTSPILFRKAYRMCDGHEADAHDMLQVTYLKALKHWPTLSGLADSQRHNWLMTTLSREVMQMWRAPRRSREAAPHGSDGPEPASADNASVIDHRDRLRQACQAIAAMDGKPAEVMALHCLAGYEIAEVAEILGMKPGTVRVHLHTARTRLRVTMAGQEGGECDDA